MQVMQKNTLEFYINAKHVQLAVAPDASALRVIREQLEMKGAKEVCAEGDCGACTIALGSWETPAKFVYRAVNSCILPASRLHGCHVITVEGLADGHALHVIQREMLEKHAVQCGYCTAGMIMALFCLFANKANPTRQEILVALEGNLCRCTGYRSIYDAAAAVAGLANDSAENSSVKILPTYATMIQQKLGVITAMQVLSVVATAADHCENYSAPKNLAELFALLREFKGDFKVINGGTDLMVQANVNNVLPKRFIDISRIPELHFISYANDKIAIGGNVTLAELQQHELTQRFLPTLLVAIKSMASNQIRNVASLAGNLANASPIADSACVLLGLNADVVLLSEHGERKVALENFYLDYKVTKLDATKEIIARVEVAREIGFCDFIKTAKRAVLDISTVNSMVQVFVDKDDVVTNCRIALGGVAKYPALAKQGMQYLVGKKVNDATIAELAKIVAGEFTPISDVRGTAEYRQLLIHNHIIKHFQKK